MRKVAAVLLGISLLLAGVAAAQKKQSPAPPGQTAEKNQAAEKNRTAEQRRRRIVAKNVELSDAEGAKFWPLYKAYRVEKNELMGKTARLLREYRVNAANIDDEKALDMLKRMQRIREKEVELSRSYVDRFAEVLPTRKVLRYYQVENRLETAARYEATRAIPMEP